MSDGADMSLSARPPSMCKSADTVQVGRWHGGEASCAGPRTIDSNRDLDADEHLLALGSLD